jgi:hypothetical protein
MNHPLTSALPRTRVDDLDRAAAAIRRPPQPRRRRHTIRPRDSLNDIAHTTYQPSRTLGSSAPFLPPHAKARPTRRIAVSVSERAIPTSSDLETHP